MIEGDAMIFDPILAKFRAALAELYGERVARVRLYGSRARGDARADSDYDVAVFLKEFEGYWAEADRLGDLRFSLMDETGAFVHAIPFPAGAYDDRTILMGEIRREGVDL